LEKEVKTIQQILKKRMEEYTGKEETSKVEGKSIIIIDDGLATGQTILLTIKSLREQNPKEIIVAVPVSSKEAADLISQEADKLITLTVPDDFVAVGQYYNEFPQVEEEEVKKIFHSRLEKH
jgi:predicted phosphoribosyltransferase